MMAIFSRKSLLAAVLGAALALGGQAAAQSSQDMSLLTEQERAAFSLRLQRSSSSAERARITAEMNRIVQQRRIELKRQEREAKKQGGAGHGPQ